MGLDCSHDAFHGSYGAFNRFRKAIATIMGGSWPPHAEGFALVEGEPLAEDQWCWDHERFSPETHYGLFVLMEHSDCDGEIGPQACVEVADDLEALLPSLEERGMGKGHIEAAGGYAAVARRFIAGCRQAAAQDEPLIFA